MSARESIANSLMVVISVTLTLVLAEIGFRIVGSQHNAETLELLDREATIPPPDEEATLGQIIRLSANPRLIYEFIPDISVQFIGQPVVINKAGFRGDFIAEDKHPGVRRVVGIGDSVMFGWGVASNESYLSVLEHELASIPEAGRWEIVNTAVPGYNTAMEIEALKDKGLRYHPDVVIVGYTMMNDTSLPNFIREPVNYFSLDRSFLIDFFRNNRFQADAIREVAEHERKAQDIEMDPQNVPAQYRDMVGIDAVKNGMLELKALSVEYGFHVVIVGDWLPGWFSDEVTALGFHTIDSKPVWRRYAMMNNIADLDTAGIISVVDGHPSALAHRATGIALAEHIKSLTKP